MRPGLLALPGVLARIALLAAALGLAAPALAQEQSRPDGLSPDQVKAIEEVVRDYLLANPEVLVDALQVYQERQRVAEQERRNQAVAAHRPLLEDDPDSPVLGNPEGDVVIVEFFDYRCPYCRRVADNVRTAVEEDGKIRLVMKEFPILGPQSQRAARAALATVNQGKYMEFHFALMNNPGDMSDQHIWNVAEGVGVDVERLKVDMQAREINRMLRRNFELAEMLDINGTPAFVIGDTVVPGAIDLNRVRELVAEARAKSS